MHFIRPAKPTDVPAIKTLIAGTLLLMDGLHEEDAQSLLQEIHAILDQWAQAPHEHIHLVCECHAILTGTILITEHRKVDLLFVHSDHQGQGLGTALMNQALFHCRIAGRSQQITLNTSSQSEDFYRCYGFVSNGEPKDLSGGCIPLVYDLADGLGNELRRYLIEQGANLVGFADLTGLPSDQRRDMPRAVVLAIALDPMIVAGITEGPTRLMLMNIIASINS